MTTSASWSKSGSIVRLVLIVTLFALVTFYPHLLGVAVTFGDGEIRVLSPTDIGLQIPTLLVSLWCLLAGIHEVVLWRSGRRTRESRWLQLALSVLVIWILWLVFISAAPILRQGVPLEAIEFTGTRIRLAQVVVGVVVLALIVAIGAAVARLIGLLSYYFPGENGVEFPSLTSPDTRSGEIERRLRRDLKDVYLFYLSTEERASLAEMGLFGKSIHLIVWLLRSMYRKLTPVRRVLLMIAILTPIMSLQLGIDGIGLRGIGFVALLAILFLELKDKLTALDELSVGRAVQEALLPSEGPKVRGWDIWLYTRPAKEVGGDLVDYVETGPGRWGFALGDVAGKGLGAALHMSKLQASLRALAPNIESLGELGSRMNTIMCRDGPAKSFASLIYIELHEDSNELRVLNAGHLPPFILRDGSILEMPRGAAALGLVSRMDYTEQEESITAGEILIAYSDGVTEAFNREDELFGERRLHDVLRGATGDSAAILGKRVLSAVKSFVGGEPASDDLSLLVLKRVQ